MNEYSVRTTGEQYDHLKSAILEGFDTFADETSAAGLQAGLVNGDKMIFEDEGEIILKNNGLLVDENTSTYDLHNFVLSYYMSIHFFCFTTFCMFPLFYFRDHFGHLTRSSKVVR
jgi:hypothetical protein